MKWCEIFRTGRHKDSKGNERVWTKSDLEKIKENFEKLNPDVPICCGHPKSNSPAYGWWDALKVVDDTAKNISKLFVSYKDVQPEFQEAVNKGLFKTRSISLTEDLIPRHIAFLGAQAPAIKGLEQFCFNENYENEILIEFNEANVNDNTESEQSEPIGEGGAPSPLEREGVNQVSNPDHDTTPLNVKGVDVLNDEQIEGSTNMPSATPPVEKGENMDLEKQLNEKDEEIAALKKELEMSKQETLKKEFEDFCDNAIKEGHILPSQKNDVINILTACGDSAMNFADSDGNEQNAGDVFKTFVNGLKQMDFAEIADRQKVDEEKPINFNDAEEVALSIQTLQKDYADKGLELNPAKALEKLRSKA